MSKPKKRKPIDYSQRLEGLKKVYGVKTDKALAEKLKVSASVIYNIKSGRTKTINKKLKRKVNSRFSYYRNSDILFMFRINTEVSYTEAYTGKRVRRWVSSDYARTVNEAFIRQEAYMKALRTDRKFYGKLIKVRTLQVKVQKRLKHL